VGGSLDSSITVYASRERMWVVVSVCAVPLRNKRESNCRGHLGRSTLFLGCVGIDPPGKDRAVAASCLALKPRRPPFSADCSRMRWNIIIIEDFVLFRKVKPQQTKHILLAGQARSRCCWNTMQREHHRRRVSASPSKGALHQMTKRGGGNRQSWMHHQLSRHFHLLSTAHITNK